MSEGWVALHRCLTEKAIWQCSTPPQKVILVTLLIMANHKENEWEWKGEKFKVKPGQFITSIDSIKKMAGKSISTKNVRTALKRFENLGFLANESAKTGRLITIVNWDKYQSADNEGGKGKGKEVAKRWQRGGKEVATNNNDNNDNNETKKEYIALFEQLWQLYPEKKGKARISDSKKKELHKHGYYTIMTCIERYKREVERKRNSGFKDLNYQNGSTFFNSGYIDYLDENYAHAQDEPEGRDTSFDDFYEN